MLNCLDEQHEEHQNRNDGTTKTAPPPGNDVIHRDDLSTSDLRRLIDSLQLAATARFDTLGHTLVSTHTQLEAIQTTLDTQTETMRKTQKTQSASLEKIAIIETSLREQRSRDDRLRRAILADDTSHLRRKGCDVLVS